MHVVGIIRTNRKDIPAEGTFKKEGAGKKQSARRREGHDHAVLGRYSLLDCLDGQQTGPHPLLVQAMRCVKWPMQIFTYFLMVAYSNAFQLWKNGRSERSLPFVDFIEAVLCNIIDEGGQETVSEDEEVEMVKKVTKVVLAPTKLSRKEWAKTKSSLTGTVKPTCVISRIYRCVFNSTRRVDLWSCRQHLKQNFKHKFKKKMGAPNKKWKGKKNWAPQTKSERFKKNWAPQTKSETWAHEVKNETYKTNSWWKNCSSKKSWHKVAEWTEERPDLCWTRKIASQTSK